ncbi:MAG TPA: hypothetical protein VJI32_06475 [Candidatus Nanoarchaeia archaeon]|nr:hypothetical protein [Candidatus Nanoarchaeia archaeon]
MCYSKEVQLITAIVIILSALFYYVYYSRKYKQSEPWLKSLLNMTTAVFLLIGLHQFFEFLSLVTNNQIIYKIGLIISISAVYFLLRSLEVLSNKKLHSWIALFIISLVSINMIFTSMDFNASSFYLQHNSALWWAAAWLFLFIYWHICAFRIYSQIKDDRSRKTMLIYLLAIADISFILSAMYVIVGYFIFSVNVCTDAPSIWCTFYVLQSFVISLLFLRLPHLFERRNKAIAASWKETVCYLAISLLILIALALTLPLFRCLTWKLVFP